MIDNTAAGHFPVWDDHMKRSTHRPFLDLESSDRGLQGFIHRLEMHFYPHVIWNVGYFPLWRKAIYSSLNKYHWNICIQVLICKRATMSFWEFLILIQVYIQDIKIASVTLFSGLVAFSRPVGKKRLQFLLEYLLLINTNTAWQYTPNFTLSVFTVDSSISVAHVTLPIHNNCPS